jgi:hypothetical protein
MPLQWYLLKLGVSSIRKICVTKVTNIAIIVLQPYLSYSLPQLPQLASTVSVIILNWLL